MPYSTGLEHPSPGPKPGLMEGSTQCLTYQAGWCGQGESQVPTYETFLEGLRGARTWPLTHWRERSWGRGPSILRMEHGGDSTQEQGKNPAQVPFGPDPFGALVCSPG